MSLCAIIPVKPLRRGKSRLSHVLSSSQREVLNGYLLQSILESLSPIDLIDHRIVISYDPSALALARNFGANTVLENRNTDINRALRRATVAAKAYGATNLLVLPADLPLITKDDIQAFLNHQTEPPEIIISSDRKLNGTNALYINPLGAINYNFGNWSFRKHVEEAERKKVKVNIFRNTNISFDLDVPEDWDQLESINFEKKVLLNQLIQEV